MGSMNHSRRKFLAATAAASVIPVAGCVSPYGNKASYTT